MRPLKRIWNWTGGLKQCRRADEPPVKYSMAPVEVKRGSQHLACAQAYMAAYAEACAQNSPVIHP